jgi:phage-related protein
MDEAAAEVHWEGDSLEILRGFPKPVREDLGADIRRLQLGERPLNARPMKSIGAGVFELRQTDEAGWYRAIYLSKVGNRIYMLHCFVKKSRKTPPNDLAVASARLKDVKARILEEKKNARKKQ